MTTYGLPKPLTLISEVERERELIGSEESNRHWLQQLHDENPNTNEMDIAYQKITTSIINGETAFYAVIGVGGAGKTQFAKKVVLTLIINIVHK